MANGMDIGSFTGSEFKGEEAIQKILGAMEKGKIPLENDKFKLQMQKEAWTGLQNKLSELNTATRDMYSPAYSSFRKITANSSADSLIQISPDGIDSNNLTPAEYSIIPKQMAAADRFKSDSLSSSQILKPSQFAIIYQEKSYPVAFAGGSLKDLANTINQACSSFLTANIIEGNGTAYIDIAGKEIGKKHKINFSGDSDFLKKIGLERNAVPTYYNIEITEPIGLSGSKDIPDLLFNNELHLLPNDKAEKQLASPQTVSSESQLWLYIKTEGKEPSKKPPINNKDTPKENPSPITGFLDKIWVGDADLLGGGLITSTTLLPQSQNNLETSAQNNLEKDSTTTTGEAIVTFYYTSGSSKSVKTTYNSSNTAVQILKAPVENGEITSITLTNTSGQEIIVSKGELITFNKGSLEHKNIITQAQNAVVRYNGIDYEKESNTIKDVIPGTLTLKGTSENPVNINIDFDHEAILEQIKNWIIVYNNTMDYIKNTTRQDADVIARMNRDRKKEMTDKREKYEKMTEEEKTQLASTGKLYEGMLYGDSTLTIIKSKLQSFISNPYQTDAQEKIRFLNQLGIARPNASQIFNMTDIERENYNAGYLDFTTEGQRTFKESLKEHFHSVQQLFYKKTGDAKLYNEGMMIEYNKALSSYLQKYVNKLPGLFLTKSQILESQISAQNKKIENLDDKMKRDESKLRRDFSKVYEAQSRAKSMNNQFARFGKGG